MHALLAQGHASPTQEELAKLALVGKRSIYNVVKRGSEEGLLLKGEPARFSPGMGLTVGVSLGAETIRAGLVDANGTVHCERQGPRKADQLLSSRRKLFPRIRTIVDEILEEGLEREDLRPPGSKRLRLLGLAIAWPAPMDRSKRLRSQVMRDGTWRRRDPATKLVPTLREIAADEIGGPFDPQRCHAINDVNAAALAVAFRKARERAAENQDDQWRVSMVIRVGGGLGSATVVMAPHRPERLSFIDSKLIEGTNGLAGELGHLHIGRRLIEGINEECQLDGLARMEYEDWRCSCGHKHHLEVFASGRGLIRRLEASDYNLEAEGTTVSRVREMIDLGEPDEHVAHGLTDVGRIVGRALAGPILMLDPYSITLTGSLASKHLVDGMKQERGYWANAIDDHVEIDPIPGDDNAFIEVQGSALAVIRQLVYRDFLDARSAAPATFAFGTKELGELRKRAAERDSD
jgi:predicted NBD/HSP70 family sugar kinase